MAYLDIDIKSLERRDRGRTERLFLMDRSDQKFKVAGTSGNIYTVTKITDMKWSCTCPDFKTRHRVCKHSYFVIDKCLNSNIAPQEYLAPTKAVEKWKKRKTTESDTVEKKPIEDEMCGICMEDLEGDEELSYCLYSCGKSTHKQCYEMWEKKKQTTCVYCRADMKKPEKEITVNVEGDYEYENVEKLLKS
jgi:hypothetical protein